MKLFNNVIRYIFFTLCIVLAVVLVLALVSIIPIDRTPYRDKSFYPLMMERLDSLQHSSVLYAKKGFSVGFAKVNLTPPFRVATAGSAKRRGKLFSSVHDSIFVRTLVLGNGSQRVAMVSADLLIIPPAVTELLAKELPTIGFTLNNTYLGATHTHNSIGNWAEGAAAMVYGAYNDSLVHFIANKIRQSIVEASRVMLPSTINAGEIPLGIAVRNRIDKEHGQIDSLIRFIEVHRSDSSKLLMLSYTAHATCLFAKDLELSRDYPGKLVDELERSGYTFAMFLAGAMGSHGCNPPEYGWDCIDWMAEQITKKFLHDKDPLREVKDTSLFMVRVPLALGEPQVKITKGLRLRPWLFRSAFGEYQPYLTALRVGDIVLLGTPCDFSGELSPSLDSLAANKGLHAMITSFNGHYIGYITDDRHYDRDHYETRLMNWYGPGNGAYLTECMTKMFDAVSKE